MEPVLVTEAHVAAVRLEVNMTFLTEGYLKNVNKFEREQLSPKVR